MPALAADGIRIVNHADRDEARAALGRPLLRDRRSGRCSCRSGSIPSHPFPQVANKSLNFIARLGGKDAFGRRNTIAIVKVPRVLPRVIRLPGDGPRQQAFVLLTSVIRAHLGELFPGREVESFSQFRITRDSDLEVDDDDVSNLRQALRSGLTTRHFGQAMRLEVVNTCPAELSEFLLEQFDLPESALYQVNGPVNLVRLNELIDLADAPRLRFAPFDAGLAGEPAAAAVDVRPAPRRATCCCTSRSSRSSRWCSSCARRSHDPEVLAIKQTIYRTGSESPLMDLLIEAARRGKEVMAVVELKARFDEEANINWAERLEAVGAQVVYGIVGLKTHAKLLLVTRREDRAAAPLCPSLHRQLQPEHRPALHRHRLPHRRPGADRRCRRGVPAARQPGPDADDAAPCCRRRSPCTSRCSPQLGAGGRGGRAPGSRRASSSRSTR